MLADLIAELSGAGRVTAEDVVRLRRAIFDDMAVSRAEAEGLIALNAAARDVCVEWRHLFLEALTDIVVRQQAPQGYIDGPTAAWLMEALTSDGHVSSDSELELLVRILEHADSAPSELTVFALSQVKAAVVDGTGPLAAGGNLETGRVNAEEAALMRRILFAAAGEANIGITRAEAEILFDINDACRGAANDPAWTDLFAKAVAASVMTVSGYQPASREAAAHRQAWVQDRGPSNSLQDILAKAFGVAGSPEAFKEGVGYMLDPRRADLAAWEMRNLEVASAQASAETVEGGEAAWLLERIGRDGRVDEAEAAVIAFLREERPQIHPTLKPLMDGTWRPEKSAA